VSPITLSLADVQRYSEFKELYDEYRSDPSLGPIRFPPKRFYHSTQILNRRLSDLNLFLQTIHLSQFPEINHFLQVVEVSYSSINDHTHTLSFTLSLCLSVSLSLFQSLTLSLCLCLSLSVSVSLCLSLSHSVSLSLSLSLCLSVSLSFTLSLCLSVSVSVSLSLSISLSLSLSVYLSVSFFDLITPLAHLYPNRMPPSWHHISRQEIRFRSASHPWRYSEGPLHWKTPFHRRDL
jgi:hypothetical protein